MLGVASTVVRHLRLPLLLLASRKLPTSLGLLMLAMSGSACGSAAQTFRLNPEQEPEQYRVTCAKRFRFCELEAEKVCGGEYAELGRLSNRPETPSVDQSDVSSTGPSMGLADWKGELTVQCGRTLPPLPLQRSESPANPPVDFIAPKAASERVCVPGETQACLGPGACKGAQACLEQGQGFGACDCGSSQPAPLGSDQSPSPRNSGP